MSELIVVVDDHPLLRVLLGDEPATLRPGGARVLTTGLWYHRLCRAVSNPTIEGALSRHIGPLPTRQSVRRPEQSRRHRRASLVA